MVLKEKTAFITGAARGIGREIALLFAKEGAKIVICDVGAEVLKKTKEEIDKISPDTLALEVDVTDRSAVSEAIQKILDKYGRIDILINNAGITRDALLMRMKESDWDGVLSVNLKGAFLCTKEVSRAMMKQRYGKIVNMASIIGIIGNAGQANYAASKGGLIAFTKTAAKELAGRNVNVNAIAPGFIQTPMTDKLPEEAKKRMLELIPKGKFGLPRDVAKAALFLSCDESDYITGQVIQVDGGMVM
jgi:3-oxoacyl-[acyl-carrier protein] reductase